MVITCIPCSKVTWKKLEGGQENSVIILLPGKTDRVLCTMLHLGSRENNTEYLFILFCIRIKAAFKIYINSMYLSYPWTFFTTSV